MGIKNRYDMLNFINTGISSFDEYYTKDVGQLIKYLDANPSEFDFLNKLIERHKSESDDVFYYLSYMIDEFKRAPIDDTFKMVGYDFYTFKSSGNVYIPNSDVDRDRYVTFMRSIFDYDFTDNDVWLTFLNEQGDDVVPDYIQLFSYMEYRLIKEGNSDWEEDDGLLIIGAYSPDVLLIVRDEKVYIMESCEEYIVDNWKYICDVSNIKEELYKSKKYSDTLWS